MTREEWDSLQEGQVIFGRNNISRKILKVIKKLNSIVLYRISKKEDSKLVVYNRSVCGAFNLNEKHIENSK